MPAPACIDISIPAHSATSPLRTAPDRYPTSPVVRSSASACARLSSPTTSVRYATGAVLSNVPPRAQVPRATANQVMSPAQQEAGTPTIPIEIRLHPPTIAGVLPHESTTLAAAWFPKTCTMLIPMYIWPTPAAVNARPSGSVSNSGRTVICDPAMLTQYSPFMARTFRTRGSAQSGPHWASASENARSTVRCAGASGPPSGPSSATAGGTYSRSGRRVSVSSTWFSPLRHR
mmetsp:Transcript_21879/g.43895  ORF Transcript_21879/g.43895 Transcript_21879/m.43895 type:complete len:232 (-) Transcript_21879:540-1235(-)